MTTPPLRDLWPEYSRWNDAIVEEFLSGSSRGRPVYLDLEQQTLVKVAGRIGVNPSDAQEEFGRVIRSTLNIPPAAGRAFQRHQVVLASWKQGRREKPPSCVALLAFLSFTAAGMVHDEKFGAGNYYGRLCDALGIQDDAYRQKIQRDFTTESHSLWETLNNWLDETGHIFGRPSAYAFDRRTHVGIAISQALMRAQDRRRLRALFIDYGLSPAQRLPLREMVRLLEDWIPKSPVTPALKRLWQRPDTHEPIAGIAQLELEAWDGGEEDGVSATRADLDLLVAADLRTHPVPQIYFAVVVRKREGLPLGPYRLGDDASPAARAALSGCGGALLLEESGAEGWLKAENSFRISVPDALQAQLELHCDNGDEWRMTRLTRRVLPLRREEVTKLCVESQRVTLGDTHLILAHQSIAGEVEEYLEQIACRGFRRSRTDGLRGLPAEWVSFWPVVVVRKGESAVKELSALTPLAEAQVTVEGGFALPGYLTWHSACPPSIRSVVLAQESVQLALVTTQALGGLSEKVGVRVLATFAGEAVTDLSGLGPCDGDYQLVLEQCGAGQEGGFLSSTSLRLRSADHPRPWVGTQAIRLRHEFSDPGWAVVAAAAHEGGESDRPVVSGAVVSRAGPGDLPVSDERQPPARPGAQGISDAAGEATEPEHSTQAQSETPPCIFGYHVFVISKRRGVYTGKCRYCGIEKEYARGRAEKVEKGQRAIAEPQSSRPIGESLSRPAVQVEALRPAGLGFDELLDGLSYARGGSWESFAGLANQLDDSPWFALETARVLVALGHIDLSMNRDKWRPEAWAIAPTAIAIVGDGGQAVLCGARSKKLLLRLSQDIASIGGAIERETSTASVGIMKLCGLDRESLATVAESVAEHVGEPIVVVDDVPRQLLSVLPGLVEVVQALPIMGWPALPVETYDFDVGAWRPIARLENPGAYRFRTRPWISAYVSVEDVYARRARIGDGRLVKYLAARELGRSLVGYDRERQSLITPWGAQLPGLYERVAVLCSGEPPVKMSDSTIAYRSVPAVIATALWRKLT
jgi:hypothetical protein